MNTFYERENKIKELIEIILNMKDTKPNKKLKVFIPVLKEVAEDEKSLGFTDSGYDW